MWSATFGSLRSALGSLRRAAWGPVRSLSTFGGADVPSSSLAVRLCGVPQHTAARTPSVFPSRQVPGVRALAVGSSARLNRIPGLTPLMALGGISPVAYMAVEATEGHLDFLSSWGVDLAKDLSRSLAQVAQAQRELAQANDRIEDLEIMVNDLTVFIEMKKEEISQLRQRVVQEVDE